MALCHVGRLYRDHLLLCELPLKRACNFSQFFVFKEEKRAPRSHEACHPGSSSLCHNAKHGLEVYNRYKELERRISSSAPHHRSRESSASGTWKSLTIHSNPSPARTSAPIENASAKHNTMVPGTSSTRSSDSINALKNGELLNMLTSTTMAPTESTTSIMASMSGFLVLPAA